MLNLNPFRNLNYEKKFSTKTLPKETKFFRKHVQNYLCSCQILQHQIFHDASGTLEAIGSIESIMEHIAATLNIDAMDVKMNNWDAQQYPKLPKFWETMQSWADIDKRKTALKNFNRVCV